MIVYFRLLHKLLFLNRILLPVEIAWLVVKKGNSFSFFLFFLRKLSAAKAGNLAELKGCIFDDKHTCLETARSDPT